MSTKIQSVKGRQILDSRGNPTVEVDLILENGVMGRAAVPSGASTGENEACELRDEEFPEARDKQRKLIYRGKGVLKAMGHVNNELKDVVVGMDAADQKTLDDAMKDADGTSNKANFGANAILGISMAAAKAVATTVGEPLYQYIAGDEDAVVLPVPMMNILNGGKHADGTVDFQEFMVQPWGASTFSEGLRMGVEIFHALKDVLRRHGHSVSVGDEGGYAPSLHDNEGAMDMVMLAILEAGYTPGKDVWIALDPATSEMVDEAKKRGKDGYCFFKSNPDRVVSSDEMIDIWTRWVNKYPIRSIEDGLDQNDWKGWAELTKRLGKDVQLVGDDLFVTNVKFLGKGIKKKCANSILVKVNQIGSLSETYEAIQLAKDSDFSAVISHRSGETEDTTIADLVVGKGTGQIKTGSGSRSDRVCKYNQLLRIEEALGDKAVYGASTWNKS